MIKDIIRFSKKWWPQILATLLVTTTILLFVIYAHCYDKNHSFGGPLLSWTFAIPFFMGLGIFYLSRQRKE
jgi:hypothetical protein